MKNLFIYLGYFALCILAGLLILATAINYSNIKVLAVLFSVICGLYFIFILTDKKTN